MDQSGIVEEHVTGNDAADIRALFADLYEHVRPIAANLVANEHEVSTSDLVQEAFVRICRQRNQIINRSQFCRIASRVMRRVLLDLARGRRSEKRGGQLKRVPIEKVDPHMQIGLDQVIDLDNAIKELRQLKPEFARVIELRFFGGCTIEETAEVLGRGTTWVEDAWKFSRAWMRKRLKEPDP